MMELLSNPETWIGLLILTFLEVVLGIDNIIFITIASNRLPESERPKARRIGLLLALGIRLLLLMGISYLVAMQEPWFHLFGYGLSGQSLILFFGGLFLIYKSTTEIRHNIEEGGQEADEKALKKGSATMSYVIFQIILIDMVFSFDSILTAVGLTNQLPIMMAAVIISMIIMMAFANPVGDFVNKHPTIQMLGLAFLILIGFMLIAEAGHKAHMIESAVPKGYIYFAIFFSLMVEFLNMKLRKK